MPTPRGHKVTDIVPHSDGTLPVEAIMAKIKAGEKIHLAESDDEAIAIDIVERVMGATTADELFSEGGVSKVADYVGIPFLLNTVHFRNSDFDEGCGIYAILSGVTGAGEMITVAAGSTNVVVKCIKGLELGAFPRWVKLTEDRTKAGFTVYDLSPAAAPKTHTADDGSTF
jgi:hypothetical protein